jgi:ribokinase
MVVKSERIPRGGETVLGGEFVMVPGGKGANQAVCAAKLGADVKLVARIGGDVFGESSLANFRSVGVDTQYVITDSSAPSGVALITVDARGENAIVVAPGANNHLVPEDVDRASDAIRQADAVVLQLEIPAETVAHTIELAHRAGVRIVLNPAPIRPMSRDLLRQVDVLVPNQHEAAELLGRAGEGESIDAPTAARELLAMGSGYVVITLGGRGAYVAAAGVNEFVDPMKVTPVDTTAAGDAFTASLVCALAEGRGLLEAARFATRVAAIVVTRMGAQPSMPTRAEAESYVFGN